jgi:hypothetical protein
MLKKQASSSVDIVFMSKEGEIRAELSKASSKMNQKYSGKRVHIRSVIETTI